MKTIKKPIALPKTDNPRDKEARGSEAALDELRTDRSYLPSSADQPVHKCGCT